MILIRIDDIRSIYIYSIFKDSIKNLLEFSDMDFTDDFITGLLLALVGACAITFDFGVIADL